MSEERDIVQEEHVENKATGVEVEEPDAEAQVANPWDPNLIRVDPKTFSLRQIIDMINDKELDLAPDFQRHKVWKPLQKSRLIESILLRIPLPAFYFSADGDGRMQVVDGLQRLSTISSFARGDFVLKDLEYLKDLDAKSYADLKDSVWIRRLHQTQISVNVIDPQTPSKVKFDIFKRINTGGEPLTAQEIRHCMSRKTSRDFLKSCTHLPSFRGKEQSTCVLADHVRMTDREVVLRFCAFHMLGNLEEYSRAESMDVFLTSATEKLDKMSPAELDALRQTLDKALTQASQLFGMHAFRKWPTGKEHYNPVNKALFEAWTVGLARYDWSQLEPRREAIVKAAREVMKYDRDFEGAISIGTGDPRKVRLRFLMVREILEKAGTGAALRTGTQILEESRS